MFGKVPSKSRSIPEKTSNSKSENFLSLSRVILVKIVQFVPHATFQKIPVRVGLALSNWHN